MTRIGRSNAAVNAAIRVMALAGIATLAVWSFRSTSGPGSVAAGYGLGWFPPTLPSHSISLPDLKWLWLALMAASLGFMLIVRAHTARQRKPVSLEVSVATVGDELALATVLDESLAALTHDVDPRRAILACYAQMERSLARRGFPRNPEETALEYASRLLARAGAPSEAIRALTALFHLAAFSSHLIDETMRQAAISSLSSIRKATR